jgi:Domain of unknown function (DUF4190)
MAGQEHPADGQERPLNSLAVLSLACGIAQLVLPFICTIPAILFGHVARRQIRESGARGRGIATAGLLLGWLGLALIVLFLVAGTLPHRVS